MPFVDEMVMGTYSGFPVPLTNSAGVVPLIVSVEL